MRVTSTSTSRHIGTGVAALVGLLAVAAALERSNDRAVAMARAEMHTAWAAMHDERARVQVAEVDRGIADGDRAGDDDRAGELEQHALAAEQRLQAEDRIRGRVARRQERDRQGPRRFRPGPGPSIGVRLGGSPSSSTDFEQASTARSRRWHVR